MYLVQLCHERTGFVGLVMALLHLWMSAINALHILASFDCQATLRNNLQVSWYPGLRAVGVPVYEVPNPRISPEFQV